MGATVVYMHGLHISQSKKRIVASSLIIVPEHRPLSHSIEENTFDFVCASSSHFKRGCGYYRAPAFVEPPHGGGAGSIDVHIVADGTLENLASWKNDHV